MTSGGTSRWLHRQHHGGSHLLKSDPTSSPYGAAVPSHIPYTHIYRMLTRIPPRPTAKTPEQGEGKKKTKTSPLRRAAAGGRLPASPAASSTPRRCPGTKSFASSSAPAAERPLTPFPARQPPLGAQRPRSRLRLLQRGITQRGDARSWHGAQRPRQPRAGSRHRHSQEEGRGGKEGGGGGGGRRVGSAGACCRGSASLGAKRGHLLLAPSPSPKDEIPGLGCQPAAPACLPALLPLLAHGCRMQSESWHPSPRSFCASIARFPLLSWDPTRWDTWWLSRWDMWWMCGGCVVDLRGGSLTCPPQVTCDFSLWDRRRAAHPAWTRTWAA